MAGGGRTPHARGVGLWELGRECARGGEQTEKGREIARQARASGRRRARASRDGGGAAGPTAERFGPSASGSLGTRARARAPLLGASAGDGAERDGRGAVAETADAGRPDPGGTVLCRACSCTSGGNFPSGVRDRYGERRAAGEVPRRHAMADGWATRQLGE